MAANRLHEAINRPMGQCAILMWVCVQKRRARSFPTTKRGGVPALLGAMLSYFYT